MSLAFLKSWLHVLLDQLSFHPVRVNKLYLVAGVLACLDGYMNIALEQTEEYVNGQLKNKYGDAFIRGNNVLYISTQKRRVWCLYSLTKNFYLLYPAKCCMQGVFGRL